MIIYADNKILFVKGWLGKSDWILPGGGIHSDESPEQGAIREIKEETGLDIPKSKLQQIGDGTVNEYGLKFDYVAFAVHLKSIEPVTMQKWELVDIAWLPAKDILSRNDLSPFTRLILQAWIDR